MKEKEGRTWGSRGKEKADPDERDRVQGASRLCVEESGGEKTLMTQEDSKAFCGGDGMQTEDES